MKTNFFENIASLQVPGIWRIGIQTNADGKFIVSALFTAQAAGDNATKSIIPFISKGTAEEIDEGFFETLTAPVQETAGLYNNLEAYLKSIEVAKQNSKMAQDKKAAEKKTKTEAGNKEAGDEGIEVAEPKPDKAVLKKAYDEAMKKVNELNDACKYEEALNLLPTVADYPEKEAELLKKAADLDRKKQQMAQALQLFNA